MHTKISFEILRLKNGFTQVELAKNLGVKQNTISMWENNHIKPSIKIIKKLAKVLNVSVEEILDCFN